MTQDLAFLACYPEAAQRTLRQFIEAFWFEGALHGELPPAGETPARLRLSGRSSEGAAVVYQIAHSPAGAFARLRLHGPLLEIRDGLAAPALHLPTAVANLIRHLGATDAALRQFVLELQHTALKQAYSMTALRPALLHASYPWQEAQLGDGHLYHPCFRSRMGFSVGDHVKFGPEFGQPFSLIWLAIDRQLCEVHALADWHYEDFVHQQLGANEYARLQQAIRAQGYTSDDYRLLPAHPWHWEQCLQLHYADWLAQGKLLFLGAGKQAWLAQQSIRSLSSLAPAARFHLKLPLAIANSSAERILSDHHVHNAPKISQWLSELCQSDAFLRRQGLEILAEPIGITLKPEHARQDTYGLLGAIWRQSPENNLAQDEQVFPFTGLTTVGAHGQLEIAPWLLQHGGENWVQALLLALLPPVLHLLLVHGVTLEAHAQNTLLIHRHGLPCRVALRDLPGGFHHLAAHPGALAQAALLRQAPHYRNAANASTGFAFTSAAQARDYLLEVLLFINLSELAHRLERLHGLRESQFWQFALDTVLAYQAQFPELDEQFRAFDLCTPELQIESLASRRLLGWSQPRFHRVPNPLHTAMLERGLK